MLVKKALRPKWLVWSVIGSVALMFFPGAAPAQAKGGGLQGFIYAEDMVTPVAGAVVKIRNVGDGREFHSGPTDSSGMFAIKTISPGRYEIGVSSKALDFNFDYQLQVKDDETAKLALSLKPDASHAEKGVVEKSIGRVTGYSALTAAAEVHIEQGLLRVGDRIRIKGLASDFFQDVRSLKYKGAAVKEVRAGYTGSLAVEKPAAVMDGIFLVSTRKAFFATPAGIAAIVGAAGLLIYGGMEIFSNKDEKSPSRK